MMKVFSSPLSPGATPKTITGFLVVALLSKVVTVGEGERTQNVEQLTGSRWRLDRIFIEKQKTKARQSRKTITKL